MAATAGCASEEGATPPQAIPLSSGVMARVANENILQARVREIAAAQRLAERDALSRAVSDALFAAEARSVLPESVVRQLERASSARALLEEIGRRAAESGPPSNSEVEELTRERWIDWDRPAAVRVVHAVAVRSEKTDANLARATAERIQQSVRGASNPEAFSAQARSVEHAGVEVRVEALPFMTPDGRGISEEEPRNAVGQFDSTFAAAANGLKSEGDQSPVIETRFGFHVILLVERLPERRVALEERRRVLEPEIISRRSRAEKNALIQRLGSATQVGVSRDIDAQTETLFR